MDSIHFELSLTASHGVQQQKFRVGEKSQNLNPGISIEVAFIPRTDLIAKPNACPLLLIFISHPSLEFCC